MSSAYIMNLKKLLDSGKSFIYIKNSSGPKMEPCGTPVTICNVLDASSIEAGWKSNNGSVILHPCTFNDAFFALRVLMEK